jgi:hypothetical protein
MEGREKKAYCSCDSRAYVRSTHVMLGEGKPLQVVLVCFSQPIGLGAVIKVETPNSQDNEPVLTRFVSNVVGISTIYFSVERGKCLTNTT